MFEIAAKRYGMDLTESGWMVADHLVADISEGRAAGLNGLDWPGTWPGHEHEADHVVTDVLQAKLCVMSAEQTLQRRA